MCVCEVKKEQGMDGINGFLFVRAQGLNLAGTLAFEVKSHLCPGARLRRDGTGRGGRYDLWKDFL